MRPLWHHPLVFLRQLRSSVDLRGLQLPSFNKSPAQVRAGQICTLEIGAHEVGLGENRASQARAGQVGSKEVRLNQGSNSNT